jgi:tetratricopeptide (TPR) repeat protein
LIAVASRLAELNDRAGAIAVLQDLARSSPPSSNEVRSLVFFWGPTAAPDAVRWTRARAETAAPGEFKAWIEHLNYLGAPGAVAEAVEARRDMLVSDPSVAELYAWALQRLGQPRRAEVALAQAVAASHDPAVLAALGRAAQATTLPRLAFDAFSRAAAQRPGDGEILLAAARAAIAARRPAEAVRYYRALFALRPQPLDVAIDAGEAMLAAGIRRDGRDLLRAALAQLDARGDRRPAALRLRARALHGLGDHTEALTLLRTLAARDPHNAELRAELLQVELSMTPAINRIP